MRRFLIATISMGGAAAWVIWRIRASGDSLAGEFTAFVLAAFGIVVILLAVAFLSRDSNRHTGSR
jgi:hypothetical protein